MTVFIINELKQDTYVHFTDGGVWTRDYMEKVLGPRAYKKLFKDQNGRWWWRFKKAHFETVKWALVRDFAGVYVIEQKFNQRFCTTQCQDGNPERADLCECVCDGLNHGEGNLSYFNVTGTLLVDTKRFYVADQYYQQKGLSRQVVKTADELELAPQLVGA